MPVDTALTPNLNDFGRFADGGPNGNWYIGFNNSWIVQLPAPPFGEYSRAFIGAKLGRAKTRPKPGRPLEREIIPGKVYMAVSAAPGFSPEQSFFLAETADLPLEPDPKTYVQGAGQAQWFWAEVPPGLVNFSGPNYLIIWSPTEYFLSASSSPILAAAEETGGRGSQPRAWLNRSIQGVPPRQAGRALETPINLLPALALRLVPQNDAGIAVSNCSAQASGRHVLVTFSVAAENAETAWVERSQDRLDWSRVSRFLRQPPYSASLPLDVLPARGGYLRAGARDMLGNTGYCEPVFLGPTGR